MAAATPTTAVSTAMTDTTKSSTVAGIGATTGAGGIQAGNDLTVSAQESASLDVELGGITVGVVGVGASVGVANVHGGATAYFDAAGSAGGDVVIDAGYEGDLQSHSYVGSVDAVAAIGASVAVIDDDALQQASVGDGAAIDSAQSLSVTAERSYGAFTATADDGELGGAAAAGAAVAKTHARGGTHAWVGDATLGGSAAQAGVGNVNLTATSGVSPSARTNALAAGIASGEGNRADALVTPAVNAHFGAGTSDAAAYLSGSFTIAANSTAEPTAHGAGVNAGALSVGVSQTTAEASPAVSAYVTDNATVSLTGTFDIRATVTDDPTSAGQASGGGLVTGAGVNATARILSDVNAFVGAGATVTAGQDVNVQVLHTLGGTADASGGDYGGLAVNQNNSTLTIKPTVSAYIAADQVTAGGGILVKANAGEAGSLPELDFQVSKVEFDGNKIVFDNPHGLATGDTITYDAHGGTPIGGLVDGMSYPVIYIDDKTVQLGQEFDPSEIDSTVNTLFFEQSHGFENGDAVIYDARGGEAVGGLTDGDLYYTNLLDPYRVKLADSQDVAENIDTILVLLDAPEAQDPDEAVVSSITAPQFAYAKADNNHSHLVFQGAVPSWKAGTPVMYIAESDGKPINHLTPETVYYAWIDSNDHLHLAKTQDNAEKEKDGIDYTDNRTGYFVEFQFDHPTQPVGTWSARSQDQDCPDCLFTGADVDLDADTIQLDANTPIKTGDLVSYELVYTGGGGSSLGISPFLSYVADVDADYKLHLAMSESERQAGRYVNLVTSADLTFRDTYAVTKPLAIATGDAYTYQAPLDVRFGSSNIQDGQIVIESGRAATLYTDLKLGVEEGLELIYDVISTDSGATPLPGLTIGQSYPYTVSLDGDSVTITLTGITLEPSGDQNDATQTQHQLRLPNFDPAIGLNPEQTYYVIVNQNDEGFMRLAATKEDANQGKFLDLTPTPTVTDPDHTEDL